MQSEQAIRNRLKQIEDDPRYQSGLERPSTVDINAPLALIQMAQEAEVRALKWVLGEK